MKEKIEKAKSWFKENWAYVAGGAATVGVIALAVIKGIKADADVIDPFVIDKGNYKWMDQLTTYEKYNSSDRFMTVRETCAALDYNELVRSYLLDKNILTKDMEKDAYNSIQENEKEMFNYIVPILEDYGFFVKKETE